MQIFVFVEKREAGLYNDIRMCAGQSEKEQVIMNISTRGRYALRMLVDIAEHDGEGYVSLGEIAERQGISKNYLEQIVALLKNADILTSTRGALGGYRLSRTPADVKVGELLRRTEGSVAAAVCFEDEPENCPRTAFCPTLPVWVGLERVVLEYLDTISLQDILDGNV